MECTYCCDSQPLVDLMQDSLFHKYAQSQNYHYTKSINEIMNSLRTSTTIGYRDYLLLDQSEELLGKLYCKQTSLEKQKMLGEYYKVLEYSIQYHNDIPRMFMLPAILPLNHYHDKKRRMEYFKIVRIIENENKNNPDKPPKGIVGDSPIVMPSEQVTEQEPSSSEDITNKNERILEGISCLQTDKSNLSQQQVPQPFIDFKTSLQLFQKQITNQPKFNYAEHLQQQQSAKHVIEDIRQQIQQMVRQKKETKLQKPVMQIDTNLDSARNQVPQSVCSAKNSNSERNGNLQRKSSLTNILSILKGSSQRGNEKKKTQQNKSDHHTISQTPRDMGSKPKTNSQSRIAALLKTQKSKCITPRTQHSNQSPLIPRKIHQLEIQVMSDLQQLLQKKMGKDSKQHCTLHLDSVTMLQDPRSLTQRITPTSDLSSKLKTYVGRKKLNIREMNQFRNLAIKIQEPLSSREPRKLNLKSKSNDKLVIFDRPIFKKQINTSGEQKQMYYQQTHSARQAQPSTSQSIPSQSTFAPNSQSSCQTSVVKDLKCAHQKSATQVHQRIKQEGILKQKLNMDSQLYKAALNLAQANRLQEMKKQNKTDFVQKSNYQSLISMRK